MTAGFAQKLYRDFPEEVCFRGRAKRDLNKWNQENC